MDNKDNIKIIGIAIITIMMISNVLAIAVTPSHNTQTPLKIPIGEKGRAFIDLQNIGEETKIKISIIEGKEIIENYQEIEGKEITIKTKETGRKINFEIEIPKDAKNGETYKIKTSIKTATPNNGMLTFNSEIITTISIIIGQEEKTPENIPQLWTDEHTIEVPTAKNYEKILVLLAALIGILIAVKVMIIITRKK